MDKTKVETLSHAPAVQARTDGLVGTRLVKGRLTVIIQLAEIRL